MNLKPYYSFFFALVLGVVSLASHAEQKSVFNGPDGTEYEVHYMAIPTTFLSKDIARRYDIMRSKSIGMINISVMKIETDGKRKSVGSVIEGVMSNDLRQKTPMRFSQVTQGSSVNYLAQVQYRESEVLTFDIKIFPQGLLDPFKIKFSQTFYND